MSILVFVDLSTAITYSGLKLYLCATGSEKDFCHEPGQVYIKILYDVIC